MAKDKKQASRKKPKNAPARARPARATPASTTRTVNKTVRDAKSRAKELASNPAVAEIVAASLVAAAAAIKNPKKARDMASAVGDELETASKQAVDRGNAFWQLAIDIARRSMEALGPEKSAAKSKGGAKKKSKK